MSHDLHVLHVRAEQPSVRDRVIAAVRTELERQGFVPATRSDAERTIRIGGTGGWLSVTDDTGAAGSLANAIARATRRPMLEVSSEAGARVVLHVYRNGARVGGWGVRTRPAAAAVAAILRRGTIHDVTEAWERGKREAFPEAALALVAPLFGMTPARLRGESALRGVTFAMRRAAKRAAPRGRNRPVLEIVTSSNRAWGGKHLMFEERRDELPLGLRMSEGERTGLALTLGGSAIESGAIDAEITSEEWAMTREGRTWHAPAARLGETRWVDLVCRAVRDGDWTMTIEASSERLRARAELPIVVMPRPYRPIAARKATDDQLFIMHGRDFVYAYITFGVPIAEAWRWARPRLEAWAAAAGDRAVAVLHDNVLVRARGEVGWNDVADQLSHHGATVVVGETFRFGTAALVPVETAPRDLMVQLVLGARAAADEQPQLAQLSSYADDAMKIGIAVSALVGEHQVMLQEITPWERAVMSDASRVKVARWHRTHLRGLDQRFWMSAPQLARIDRGALGRLARVTPLGSAVRVELPSDQPRSALRPVEEVLQRVLPA